MWSFSSPLYCAVLTETRGGGRVSVCQWEGILEFGSYRSNTSRKRNYLIDDTSLVGDEAARMIGIPFGGVRFNPFPAPGI